MSRDGRVFISCISNRDKLSAQQLQILASVEQQNADLLDARQQLLELSDGVWLMWYRAKEENANIEPSKKNYDLARSDGFSMCHGLLLESGHDRDKSKKSGYARAGTLQTLNPDAKPPAKSSFEQNFVQNFCPKPKIKIKNLVSAEIL